MPPHAGFRHAGRWPRYGEAHSGKCLDVAKASADDHVRLIQYTCGTGANQQFQRPAI
ncbi:RICIN domain-containing protein [Streptomyces sp. NPDC002402]